MATVQIPGPIRLVRIKMGNGLPIKYLFKRKNWENKKNSIIFSGLNNRGIWAKKK
jgi:hypothetical protein